MDESTRRRTQLECLYEMFRDRIEENVVYIVYTENEGKIDATIDQLMSISACSFTGHHFEPKTKTDDSKRDGNLTTQLHEPETKASTTRTTCLTNSLSSSSFQQPVTLRPLNPDSTLNGVLNLAAKNNASCSTSSKTEDSEQSSDVGSISDDPSLDIDERIAILQRAIDDLLSEKGNCHDKASQYLSKRMFPVTSYYSELASQYRRMIEQKTQQMVDLLLIKSENANHIDLHGLNPIQARLVVSELLKIRQEKLSIDKQGEVSIDIITGWGKHCVTNGQRIKPAVVSLLREKGFDFHRINRGALRVTIRRC